MKIACLLSEGFEDIEALGTIALLRRAQIECDLISVFNEKTVKGSYQTKVVADKMMNKVLVSDYDGLFIPGGRHATLLRETTSVKQLVKEFYDQKKWLMAICAGPSVFGVMGFLDGVKYTSFPSTEIYMPKAHRIATKAIRDGYFITGVGAGAVYEFAFEIIEALLGKEKRIEIEKRTQYVLN